MADTSAIQTVAVVRAVVGASTSRAISLGPSRGAVTSTVEAIPVVITISWTSLQRAIKTCPANFALASVVSKTHAVVVAIVWTHTVTTISS